MDIIAECKAYEDIQKYVEKCMEKDGAVVFSNICMETGYDWKFVVRACTQLVEDGKIGQIWIRREY